MNQRKYVFAQLQSMIIRYEFDKCVNRYNGDYKDQPFMSGKACAAAT